jgi:hypothetical protein
MAAEKRFGRRRVERDGAPSFFLRFDEGLP